MSLSFLNEDETTTNNETIFSADTLRSSTDLSWNSLCSDPFQSDSFPIPIGQESLIFSQGFSSPWIHLDGSSVKIEDNLAVPVVYSADSSTSASVSTLSNSSSASETQSPKGENNFSWRKRKYEKNTAPSRLNSSSFEKKMRHRDLEMERRHKMNEKFKELHELCPSQKKDKATILESGFLRIQHNYRQISEISSSLATISSSEEIHEEKKPISPHMSQIRQPQPCNYSAGIAEISIAGNIVSCNDAFLLITNVNRDQIEGLSLFNLIDHTDLLQIFEIFQELLLSPVSAARSFTVIFPISSIKTKCTIWRQLQCIHLLAVALENQ